MLHTHTRPTAAGQMKWKWKWDWRWNEIYLTRTRRGERKRRGTERTPTQHTWPGTGRPWKGKKKERKAEADGQRNKTSGGGGKDGSAWTNLTRRKPTPTLAREGPNLTEEGRTQEHMRKGTRGGLVDEDASTLSCKVPSLRLNGPDSRQPCGRFKQSTPELHAQLNLTNDHKKKEKPHLKNEPAWAEKNEASHSGQLFQHNDIDRWNPEKKGQLSHFT